MAENQRRTVTHLGLGACGPSEPTTGVNRRAIRPEEAGAAPARIEERQRFVVTAMNVDPDSTPHAKGSSSEVACAPLEPREAFILSLVDGSTTVEAIVDLTGLQRQEALGVLARLARLRSSPIARHRRRGDNADGPLTRSSGPSACARRDPRAATRGAPRRPSRRAPRHRSSRGEPRATSRRRARTRPSSRHR